MFTVYKFSEFTRYSLSPLPCLMVLGLPCWPSLRPGLWCWWHSAYCLPCAEIDTVITKFRFLVSLVAVFVVWSLLMFFFFTFYPLKVSSTTLYVKPNKTIFYDNQQNYLIKLKQIMLHFPHWKWAVNLSLLWTSALWEGTLLFSTFCGINISTITNFKLSPWHQWTWSWEGRFIT